MNRGAWQTYRMLGLCVLSALIQIAPLGASDWLDQIGFSALERRLGVDIPTGTGVRVSQIEAPSQNDGHLPQAGAGRFTGRTAFADKAFNAKSGRGAESDHAKIVGHYLYGANPLRSFGAVSLSPGVREIDLYRAGVHHYLGDDFIQPLSSRSPKEESNAIQNHSWYGHMGGASPEYMNDVLRRLDHTVQRDDYLCVVALGNDPNAPIPPLLASAFNVLAIGCSSGEHNRGTTHEALDGPGRGKPDLVAPLSATSYSTPVVSSAAALLMQCSKEESALREAAHSLTQRAILMAGASKERFRSDWSREDSRPFDPVYGAGELNVDRSHRIMERQQWRYQSLESPSDKDTIALELSQPLSELSVVLVWDREVEMRRGEVVSASVADLSLRLRRFDSDSEEWVLVQESVSPNENREHVYARGLPSGKYVLEIEGDGDVTYGVAWDVAPEPVPAVRWVGDSLEVNGLTPGMRFTLERSLDLKQWEAVQAFVAGEDEGFVTRALVGRVARRGFYRLVWTSGVDGGAGTP